MLRSTLQEAGIDATYYSGHSFQIGVLTGKVGAMTHLSVLIGLQCTLHACLLQVALALPSKVMVDDRPKH